jgi:hypothetical protein
MSKEPLKGGPPPRENLYPELIPPTVPELRRVMLAMAAPEFGSESSGWDGRCGAGLTRRWPGAAIWCHMVPYGEPRTLLREKTSEKKGEPSSVAVVSTTSTLHRASAKLADEQLGAPQAAST